MIKFSVLVATSFFLVLVSIAAGEEDGSSSGGGGSWLSALEDGNGKPPVFPTACVKMALYNNTKCEGHAQRVLMIPTWAKPHDSPCFHDPKYPYFSVDNQYCDTSQDGIYHVNLYPLNGECQATSYTQYFSPVKLAIPPKTCYLGFKIEHCKKGPCFAKDEEEEADLSTAAEAAQVVHQYLRLGGALVEK